MILPMTVAIERRITLEEYLNDDDLGRPIDRPIEGQYELVDGVLVEMGAENPLNPKIASFLLITFFQLGIPVDRLVIGQQIGVSPVRATARQPDLIVHSADSDAAIMADGKLLRFGMPAPMLVVEVVSSRDTDQKSHDRDYHDRDYIDTLSDIPSLRFNSRTNFKSHTIASEP
jgi:Uma2 family endonuclease